MKLRTNNYLTLMLLTIALLATNCKTEDTKGQKYSYNMITKSAHQNQHAKQYLPIETSWKLPDEIPTNQEFPLEIQIFSLEPMENLEVQLQIPDFLELVNGNPVYNFGTVPVGEIKKIALVLRAERQDLYHLGVNLNAQFQGKRQGMAQIIDLETKGYAQVRQIEQKVQEEAILLAPKARTEIIPNQQR